MMIRYFKRGNISPYRTLGSENAANQEVQKPQNSSEQRAATNSQSPEGLPQPQPDLRVARTTRVGGGWVGGLIQLILFFKNIRSLNSIYSFCYSNAIIHRVYLLTYLQSKLVYLFAIQFNISLLKFNFIIKLVC